MRSVNVSREDLKAYSDAAKIIRGHWLNKREGTVQVLVNGASRPNALYSKIVSEGVPLNAARRTWTDGNRHFELACPCDDLNQDVDRIESEVFGVLIHEWTHQLQEIQNPDLFKITCDVQSNRNEDIEDPQHHWDTYYRLEFEQEAHGAQAAAEMMSRGVQEWDEEEYLRTLAWKRAERRLLPNKELLLRYKEHTVAYAMSHFSSFNLQPD